MLELHLGVNWLHFTASLQFASFFASRTLQSSQKHWAQPQPFSTLSDSPHSLLIYCSVAAYLNVMHKPWCTHYTLHPIKFDFTASAKCAMCIIPLIVPQHHRGLRRQCTCRGSGAVDIVAPLLLRQILLATIAQSAFFSAILRCTACFQIIKGYIC